MEGKFVSVDSFLQELSTEGRLDSAGKFTLSVDHAKEKLSEFLLESTEEYLLKLVQAGVAAGATALDLHSSTTRVRFCMHGVSLDPADLRQILNHLLQPSQSAQARTLRHLAIAVNTAVMTRATGMVLATWDGNRGEHIEWKAEGRKARPWKLRPGAPSRVYFEVLRTGVEFFSNFIHLLSQRDILSMLVGSRAGLDPDRLLVMDRAIWSPVPIRLNGRWLPRPALGPPEAQISSIFGPRSPMSQQRWLSRDSANPGIRNFDPQAIDWPWSRNYRTPSGGTVGIGTQPTFENVGSYVQWVFDGVLTQLVPLESARPRLFGWAVLPAYDCSTDVTGLRLIENERLQDLAQPGLQVLQELFEQVRPGGEPPRMPAGRPSQDNDLAQSSLTPQARAAWAEVRKRRERNSGG